MKYAAGFSFLFGGDGGTGGKVHLESWASSDWSSPVVGLRSCARLRGWGLQSQWLPPPSCLYPLYSGRGQAGSHELTPMFT